MSQIYLDHAATTPVAEPVKETINVALTELYGNPSSVHSMGKSVREAVDKARKQVASAICAQPDEIIFTGGGTEADNLALIGGARSMVDRGNHVITTAIEHHAVLHTAEWMEEQGWDVTVVDVGKDGRVCVDAINNALTDQTVLVSVMMANNEVGTIQPIKEIAELVRKRGVLMHTDAVQALGQIPIDVNDLSVDLLTISAHKVYGPKGVGALYINADIDIEPIIFGGGHERGYRAGTENVPGIMGLGTAASLASEQLSERREHLLFLRNRLKHQLLEIDGIVINGHETERLPNNLNISVLDVEGEALLLNLDLEDIAVSSGSACTSGSIEPSHVLKAMGIPKRIAQGSVRMTLGMQNTQEQIDRVCEVMKRVCQRLRDMSPLTSRGRR